MFKVNKPLSGLLYRQSGITAGWNSNKTLQDKDIS